MASLLQILNVLLVSAVVGAQRADHAPEPSVKIANGSLIGLYDKNWSQDLFLGIPYAQPPVGDLRLRLSEPINRTWDKPLQVQSYGQACVSYGGDNMYLPMSEDCLTLNVVRGAGVKKGAALPVAVWIHGGGFGDGSSRDQRYNLSAIVKHSYDIGTPMMGVSINYRLNFYGFLHSDDVVGTGTTNLGLRDQRLELRWIQENIRAFGGDPSKVTIWGESAGATAVGLHLVSYGGRDDRLFRGAIMESGSPLRTYMDPRKYQAQYDAIIEQTGCNNSVSRIDCLRQLPLQRIHEVVNGSGYGFFPTPDGDILRTRSSIHLERGEFVQVPILIGANTDEGTGFAPHPVPNNQVFKDYLTNGSFVNEVPGTIADQIIKLYEPANDGKLEPGPDPDSSNGGDWAAVATFTGDQNFIAARRQMCRLWASRGLAAYCYRWNVDNSATPPSVGVTHFEEIPFVFLNFQGLGYDTHGGNPFRNKGPAYKKMAYTTAGMWASFVAEQNPTAAKALSNSRWPKYTQNEGNVHVFDVNLTNPVEVDNWRGKQIDYLNTLEPLFKK